ncbi:hypothetical protein [Flavobacterium sp. 3-210]
MTVFSYVISASARELYKEPVLLAYILSSLKVDVSPQVQTFLGWLLHYLIGVVFVLIYHYLWLNNIIEMSWPAAFVLGAASGIIGILSWVFLFKIVHQKSNIVVKGYYVQLFFAHVIFAIVALMIYKLFS